MIKHQKRTIEVIVILLMLGASPLSVTCSFTDIEGNQDKMEENVPNIPKNTQKMDLEQFSLKR